MRHIRRSRSFLTGPCLVSGDRPLENADDQSVEGRLVFLAQTRELLVEDRWHPDLEVKRRSQAWVRLLCASGLGRYGVEMGISGRRLEGVGMVETAMMECTRKKTRLPVFFRLLHPPKPGGC